MGRHIPHLVNDIRDEYSWCDTSFLKRRLERRCAIQMNLLAISRSGRMVSITCELHPEWISLNSIELRVRDVPFDVDIDHNPDTTPALWLDALTHASEWAGMIGLIHTVDQWVDWTQEERGRKWFEENTIYCVPCVSPDGLEALMRGEPFLRSSTREAKEGVRRVGFEPCDVDGNEKVRWMRWKDPAGPYVADDNAPFGLRKRRLDDAPEEGLFRFLRR